MIAWLGTKLGKMAAGIGGLLILLFGAFLKGRKSKADEVQAETAKTIIKTVKEVRKNEERINNLNDDDLDKQLLNDSRNSS